MEPLWKMFVKQFAGLMHMVIGLAAFLSMSKQNWSDVAILMVLLFTSVTSGFLAEKNAQACMEAPNAGLEKKWLVKRNGQDCYVSQ